jgi:UDP-N-acetylmuramyl pentapeptide phosphotransferase/UDP-N-acetylglucosamine-1-phosphate transferase
MGSVIKYVLIKAHYSIGIVERYYAPLCQAFEIITEELSCVLKQFVLQMVIKAVNDTAGPDGLVSTLLVFGTYP